MYKSWIHLLLTLVLFVLLPSPSAQAAQTVTVTLPDFPITLNGISLDNDYRTYPFVVYKGITYCPMTFYDSRFLGLETEWDNEDGLTIEATDVVCGLHEDKSNKRNKKSEMASIADQPIRVNGQLIDNGSEDYPVLTVNDVAYFPLSWHYAQEVFKWDYGYDDATGLVINSKNNVMLPKAVPKYDNNGGEIFLDNGMLYYEGDDGGIYRVSLETLDAPQKFYQKKPRYSDENGPSYWSSKLKDMGQYIWVVDQGVLINKQTAAVKKVNNDGLESAGYPYNAINVAMYDNKLFYVDDRRLDPENAQHLEPGNLYMEQADGTRVQIGDKRYIYGEYSFLASWTYGLSPRTAMDFADNALYIVAAKPGYPEQFGSTLCRIDLNTNETSELYHTNGDPILEWVIDGDDLYYLVESGKNKINGRAMFSLYVRSLKDGKTSKVSATDDITEITDLQKFGDTIYFDGFDPEWGCRSLKNPKQFVDIYGFRDYDPVQDDPNRWIDQNVSVYESHGYMIYCMQTRMGRRIPGTDYRTLVFDPEGEMVFRSADIVKNVTVDQLGNIAYTIWGQPDIYFGHIKN